MLELKQSDGTCVFVKEDAVVAVSYEVRDVVEKGGRKWGGVVWVYLQGGHVFADYLVAAETAEKAKEDAEKVARGMMVLCEAGVVV